MTLATFQLPQTAEVPMQGGVGFIPLLAAGAIVLGVLVLIVWTLRSMRQPKPFSLGAVPAASPGPGERLARLIHPQPATTTVQPLQKLMNDAEELTRAAAEHLDAKAREIEQLLVEADRRIAELKALSETTGARAVTPAAIHEVRPFAGVRDSVMERIYAMSDEGRQPVEIARELDEHLGKVELIIALRASHPQNAQDRASRTPRSAASA